eukprot:m51a1_g1697 putative 60S ribosomal protein L36e (151) ;mRNA; f:482793-483486
MVISVGLKRGFNVTKRVKKAPRNPAKGTTRAIVKDVIREISGFTPYERRVLELLRNGFDKRALRLCKRRLGTMTRAKRKREEMSQVMQRARLERQAHAHEHDHEHEKEVEKAKKAAPAKKAVKKTPKQLAAEKAAAKKEAKAAAAAADKQ